MIELDRVDRGDRDLGVGIRGEQHPLGVRVDLARRGEELDAGHPRHALVREEERDGRAAQLQAPHDVECGRAALGGDDPIGRPEAAPQVALDRAQDLRIVVDRDDDGVLHVSSARSAPWSMPRAATRARRQHACREGVSGR